VEAGGEGRQAVLAQGAEDVAVDVVAWSKNRRGGGENNIGWGTATVAVDMIACIVWGNDENNTRRGALGEGTQHKGGNSSSEIQSGEG
jgi:hypothetical protein